MLFRLSVRREVWMSVRMEQNDLMRIRSVMRCLSHIFRQDSDFLLGKTERLDDF